MSPTYQGDETFGLIRMEDLKLGMKIHMWFGPVEIVSEPRPHKVWKIDEPAIKFNAQYTRSDGKTRVKDMLVFNSCFLSSPFSPEKE